MKLIELSEESMEQPQAKEKKKSSYYAWLLILASLILFIVAGYPLLKQLALDVMGVETTGTVIDIVGSKNKAPIVRFTTAQGQEVEFKSGLATNFVSFSKGEEVEIRYLASLPQVAEVTVLGRINYFTSVGGTCLGVIFLLGGLISLRAKPLVLDFSKKK